MTATLSSEHPLNRYPTGWFAVALGRELKAGEVRAVRVMGRELVLFRKESGEAALLDAYCAHIGAHLGHGGKVDGECVRCPFHGWAYDSSGACVSVPYARKVPPAARVRSYPVRERNGVVLAWFDADGAEPDFEIPALEEGVWSKTRWAEYETEVHLQEIAENGIDIAHFPLLHKTTRASLRLLDGKRTPFHFWLMTAYDGDGIGVPGRTVRVSTEWRYYGPGVFHALSTADDFGTRVEHLFHFTPVPGDRVRFRAGIRVDLSTVPAAMVDFVLEKNAEITVRNLEEDAPLWAQKRYLTRAALCEGDGPFGPLRRWARRFYDGAAPAASGEREDDTQGDLYSIDEEGVVRLRALAALAVAPSREQSREPEPEPAVEARAAASSPELSVEPTREAVRQVFFESIPRSFNPEGVESPFVVQYEVAGEAGGVYFIEVDAARCVPNEGRHASPALTVSIEAGDWVRLNRGLLDGTEAFLSGKLKVDGDFTLAMKLAVIFPLPTPA